MIFIVGPVLWTPERHTDAVANQGEILQGYVDGFDDVNWRETVPKVQAATRALNDEIYRLREKLGEDKPWHEKPWYWLGTFAVLMYALRKQKTLPQIPVQVAPVADAVPKPKRQGMVYMLFGPNRKGPAGICFPDRSGEKEGSKPN